MDDSEYGVNERYGNGALAVRWDLGSGLSPSDVAYTRFLVSEVIEAVAMYETVQHGYDRATGLLLRRHGRYYLQRRGTNSFESFRPRPVVAASGYTNPAFEILAVVGAVSAVTTAVLAAAGRVLDLVVRARTLGAETQAKRDAYRKESAQSEYMVRVYDQASSVDVPPWMRSQFGASAATEEHAAAIEARPSETLNGRREPTRHKPTVSADIAPQEALQALTAENLVRAIEALAAAGQGRRGDLQVDVLSDTEATARISVARATSIALGELAIGEVSTDALTSRIEELLHPDPSSDPEHAPKRENQPNDTGRPQLGGGRSMPWIAP